MGPSPAYNPWFNLMGQSPSIILGGAGGTVSMNDGKWHHLVGIYDNAEVAIYVDGVKYSQQLTGNVTTRANFEIGRDNTKLWEPGRWFQGLIDEVRIYGRAMTPAEIQDLYHNP